MAARASARSELAILRRLCADLVPFVRRPLDAADCRRRVREGIDGREASFLDLVEHAVFGVARSPYLWLLDHAGVGFPDLRRSVRVHGLERTLSDLHAAGVFVTLDEFKGRRPIVRDGRTLETRSHDFDNPLSTRHFMSTTGGSRSTGTRVYVDLAHCARDAVYDQLFLEAFGLVDRPWAVWRPPPPFGAGIKSVLSHAKLGHTNGRWFAQSRLRLASRAWKHAILTELLLGESRILGRPIPRPEFVPLAEAWRVAAWAARCRERGTPGWLNTNAASGVRVATAARDRGLDISGTLFRLGGEPLTQAKAEAIGSAGARAVCHYTMGEVGRIGVACERGAAVDDVHIVTDKMAVLQRPRVGIGEPVTVNVYTTLLPLPPKLMLNVESDDYGTLTRRSCGCLLDELGYDLHLHEIRSWEKLTSEGMNFLGADIVRLVEQVLPGRFGGGPTDYQFVEEEEEGLPKVSLLVSPRVGHLEEGAVLEVVLGFLDVAPGPSGRYADRWREGDTLRIRRQEPLATGASKVLALHMTRKRAERP